MISTQIFACIVRLAIKKWSASVKVATKFYKLKVDLRYSSTHIRHSNIFVFEILARSLILLVAEAGIEPATQRFSARMVKYKLLIFKQFFAATSTTTSSIKHSRA